MQAIGIFTLNEVARYTRVPASTVRSWFMPRSDGAGHGPIFSTEWTSAGEWVSFVNMIEVHVASFFRAQGVKPSMIRAAHCRLQRDLATPHPFAHAELSTDKRSIIRHSIEGEALSLVDAVTRQRLFHEMAEGLHQVEYDRSTQLANRWRIAQGVVIDPRLRSGQPVAYETGITTEVLASQFSANGHDAALVAHLFGIAEHQVNDAVAFQRSFSFARHAA